MSKKRRQRRRRQTDATRSAKNNELVEVVRVPYWEFPQLAQRAVEIDPTTDVQGYIDILMASPIRLGPSMTPTGPGYPLTTFSEWADQGDLDVESLIYRLEDARRAGLFRWREKNCAYEMRMPTGRVGKNG